MNWWTELGVIITTRGSIRHECVQSLRTLLLAHPGPGALPVHYVAGYSDVVLARATALHIARQSVQYRRYWLLIDDDVYGWSPSVVSRMLRIHRELVSTGACDVGLVLAEYPLRDGRPSWWRDSASGRIVGGLGCALLDATRLDAMAGPHVGAGAHPLRPGQHTGEDVWMCLELGARGSHDHDGISLGVRHVGCEAQSGVRHEA